MHCLSEDEYRSKLSPKMFEVSETAEAILDIWPYVLMLVQNNIISEHVYKNNIVEYVYCDSLKKYDHILLPTAISNIFIILVVNIPNVTIDGHYTLNLENEYGLS